MTTKREREIGKLTLAKSVQILQTSLALVEAAGVPILAIDNANNAVVVTIGGLTYQDGNLTLLATSEATE